MYTIWTKSCDPDGKQQKSPSPFSSRRLSFSFLDVMYHDKSKCQIRGPYWNSSQLTNAIMASDDLNWRWIQWLFLSLLNNPSSTKRPNFTDSPWDWMLNQSSSPQIVINLASVLMRQWTKVSLILSSSGSLSLGLLVESKFFRGKGLFFLDSIGIRYNNNPVTKEMFCPGN